MNCLPTGILNFKSLVDIFSTYFEIPSSISLEPSVFCCSEKNQKGYRCYYPNTRRMHTTMNCDFVEGEYFYSQSSSLGETQASDNNPENGLLNWLPMPPIDIDPKENQSRRESQPNLVTDVGPTEEVSNTTRPSNPTKNKVTLPNHQPLLRFLS